MTLSLVNESDHAQMVRFFPYDAEGVELSRFAVELTAQTLQVQAAATFLGPLTSHVRVECYSCSVQWSYDLENQGPGQPLFALHHGGTYAASYDWNHGVEGAFGLALVNTTNQQAAVDLLFQSQNKVLRRERITLGPWAKALVEQDAFNEFEQVELGIQSDQTLAILGAQRSWSGSVSNFFPRSRVSELTIRSQDLVVVPDKVLRQVLSALVDRHPQDGLLSLGEMQQLRTLDCSGRGIRSLAGLQYASNLKELFCNDNQIVDASPIEHMTQLEVLDLSENPLKEPPKLEEFSDLHTLVAERLGLEEVPESWLVPTLTELSLYYNRIAVFDPPSLPKSLKSVNLRSNRLTVVSLSDSFIEWVDLSWNSSLTDRNLTLPASIQTLLARYCKFSAFDYDLTNLMELDLSYNKSISDSFVFHSESLQVLTLQGCTISILDLKLPNLKSLDMRSTDAELIAANYPAITQLAFNPRGDHRISGQVIQLTQLEELSLRGGDLIRIDDLLLLSHLKTVDLTHNQLRENMCPVLIELVDRGVEVTYRRQGTYSLTCSAQIVGGKP